MRFRVFSPGDGTRYRVAYELLPAGQEEGSAVRERLFFAFGLGFHPMVAFVFPAGELPPFEYFSEKFAAVGENVSLRCMGWLALHAVSRAPLPAELPEGCEHWYAQLHPAWVQEVAP